VQKKINNFIFCVLITMALTGCSAINFKKEYNDGLKAYNDKNYNNAITSFNNALSYKPDSYSTLCLLGASYTYQKDYTMAEKTFKDAINLYPNNWNAYIFLGDIKKAQRDYQSAIDFYETAITLESMGGKEKLYYKNYIKKIKEEQAIYLNSDPIANQKSKNKLKNEIINSYSKSNKKNDIKTKTGEVIISLDSKIWQKYSDQKDEKSRIVQYVIKGEDLKNFIWTKLITIQYFALTDNFKTTLNDYYNMHTNAIAIMAKNSNKSFEKKIIQQSKSEIIYEWNFDNGKETEIARIIFEENGIYHLHFSKKGVLDSTEKSKYITILKEALLH